jgi:hypothetical protein
MGIILTALVAFLLWGLTFGYWMGHRRQLKAAAKQRALPDVATTTEAGPPPPDFAGLDQAMDQAGRQAPSQRGALSETTIRRLGTALDTLEQRLQNMPTDPARQATTLQTMATLMNAVGQEVDRGRLPTAIQEQFRRLDTIMQERFAGFDERVARMMRDAFPGGSTRWEYTTTTETTTTRPRRAQTPAAPPAQARPQAPSEPTVPDHPRPSVWQRLRDPSWLTTKETPQAPSPRETPKKTS